jgi:selenocysteine-specific elongation factor
LETRASGTPEERLLEALAAGPRDVRDLARALDLDLDSTRLLLATQIETGAVVTLGETTGEPLAPNRLVALRSTFDMLAEIVVTSVGDYHQRFPLRRGMPREDVRSRLTVPNRVFDALALSLAAAGRLHDRGGIMALPNFAILLTPPQQHAADRYIAALATNPNAPPAPAEFGMQPELLAALEEIGAVVRLPDNVVFGTAQLAGIRAETLNIIDEQGEITLASFRDHFGTSRKYAQAVLEYFDQQRITRRVGDVRVRGAG